MSNVSGAVKSIQDIMRKDVGVDGDAQRISQMVWMIFLKIYDDREEELEFTEDDFASPIPERFRWRNWATNREGITGDALVKFVDELFSVLKYQLPTIGEVGKRAQVIRDVFEDKPFMTSDDLMSQHGGKPSRYVIDFSGFDLLSAQKFGKLYKQLETAVVPARRKAADEEAERNSGLAGTGKRGNQHHANFLRTWWQMSYPRAELMSRIAALPRYIVCGQVTKRPIFDFVSPSINPNAALTVFAYADDYAFGVLQSTVHWHWFTNRCSTLTERFRYTSNTVFDSFPWPQSPSLKQVKDVAAAGVALRKVRLELCAEHGLTLRELYRSIELPGDHPLKKATAKLDQAVRAAYGLSGREDVLAFLLALNHKLADDEASGTPIVGPGLLTAYKGTPGLVTADCIVP